MMLPADLSNALRLAEAPKRDEQGRCLHTRACYVRILSSSAYACPDCNGYFWRGDPRNNPEAQ